MSPDLAPRYDAIRFKKAVVDYQKKFYSQERTEFRERFILGAQRMATGFFCLDTAMKDARRAEQYIFGSVPGEE